MNRFRCRLVYREDRHCFVLAAPTKQNRPWMKPFSAFGEGHPKRLAVKEWRNETTGRQGLSHGDRQMIKALSAVAAAAFIAAALTVLPGFAPKVEASVPQVLAKSDRLAIRPIGRDCSEQAWPNFEASCLRTAGTRTNVRQARLVTADRTP